jgi:hypothetical protein
MGRRQAWSASCQAKERDVAMRSWRCRGARCGRFRGRMRHLALCCSRRESELDFRRDEIVQRSDRRRSRLISRVMPRARCTEVGMVSRFLTTASSTTACKQYPTYPSLAPVTVRTEMPRDIANCLLTESASCWKDFLGIYLQPEHAGTATLS